MHRVQASQDLYGLPDSPPLAANKEVDDAGEPTVGDNGNSSSQSPPTPPPTPRSPNIPPENNTPPGGYDFWTWRAIQHWPRPYREVCFADYSRRLASFSGHWPADGSVPDAAKLAEAGFYFDGELHCKTYIFFTPYVIRKCNVIFCYLLAWEDMTTCFLCGGTLTQWLANDNGWFEHGVYYPRCMFVRFCKGDDFIASCEKEYLRRCHDRNSK
jgi:hypothetical protein